MLLSLNRIIYFFIIFDLLSANEFGNIHDVHNKEHLKEHLQNVIDVEDNKLSKDQELFYYFKIHDTNNDSYLDGKEIIDGFINHDHNIDVQALPTDETLEVMVDDILKNFDADDDGLISYTEYVTVMLKE
uniref:EF-hand domain-containing protein n=1 Tax=Parastrongyloides trichosuri TaxID=131310 RepID=A0A0N4ZTD3_PARTI